MFAWVREHYTKKSAFSLATRILSTHTLSRSSCLFHSDIDDLLKKSNLEAIIARSSSGVFTVLVDGFRSQLCVMDQAFQRLGRCACFDKRPPLPPMPRQARNAKQPPCPKGNSRMGVAVQDRYAGILSRSVAFFIDQFILWLSFAIFALMVTTLYEKISGYTGKFDPELNWLLPLIYLAYSSFYEIISLTFAGRTIGLGVIGLLVVKTNGHRIGFFRSCFLTFLQIINVFFFFTLIIGWIRRDGRQLPDLFCCTGVVYKWDARVAALREEQDPTMSIKIGGNYDVESQHME